MNNVMSTLVLVRGKITCRRCAAKSKRTGRQCGRPAVRGKGICNFHGGRSTGPKTETVKARQRPAATTSGNYTEAALKDKRRSALKLAAL
jgi:hypothetical protein